MVKQRRVEDIEGRITGVSLQEDRLTITHSKIGEGTPIPYTAEFPVLRTEMEE